MTKKKISKDAMPPFAIRIERHKVEKAMALGIDIPRLFRGTLDKFIAMKEGKCPTCGRKNENDKRTES